ncbi:MAG: cation:proton antiporter [candidate division KSB1 bacterium]|nr:cation:proton antiporter [candidate division KSB1 bacterium]MDQ7065481.1 cation:proton antiporter [candidate division KSB1 bacterium]
MFDLFPLILLFAIAAGVRWVNVPHSEFAPTFYLGFILLTAYFLGRFGTRFRLPKISGYILAGILFGPHLLNLLSHAEIDRLRLIDGLALALIALIAGGELKMKEIQKQLASILSVLVFQVTIVFIGISLTVLLFHNMLPVTRDLPLNTVIIVAIFLGVTAVAKSPATTIAIINEYRARGPMTDLVLGVTILKDVVVLLIFAVVMSVSRMLAHPGQSFDATFLMKLVMEIGLSLSIGAGLGGLFIFYLKRIRTETEVFLLLSVLLVAEFAPLFHLDALLLCIAAGFVVQNFSQQGKQFIEAIERSVLPVLVLFFAIAGAGLDLDALFNLWEFAIALVLLRLAFTWIGTYTGIRVVHGNKAVEKYGWTGFVAQAGVTLGMAILIERSFPDWGSELKTLIIAAITVNQVIGPVLFRYGLFKARETAEFRKYD